MANESENIILEHLRALRSDIASINLKLDRVVTEQRSHSRTLNILVQEGRMVRAAVNDIAKENVTLARWKPSTRT
jgi:uncharacterized protein